MQRQAIDWEQMFAYHILGKELAYIHKTQQYKNKHFS